MVKIMKTVATSFKMSHAYTAAPVPLTLQQDTADPHLCQRLLVIPGKSGSVSCGVTAPFSSPGAQGSVVPSQSLFPSPVHVPGLCGWGQW